MQNTELLKLITEVGVPVAMLLTFLWALWKQIEKKDARIKELSDEVLHIVKENTQVQTELKHSIKENTQASRTLTKRVGEVLSNNRRKE